MRMLLSAAVLAAGVTFSVADDPKKSDDKAAEKKAEGTPKEKFAAIQKKLRTDQQDWMKEYQSAEPAERSKLMNKRGEIMTAAAKAALALAKEHPTDEVALDALTMAIQVGNPKIQSEAGDFLIEKFGDDDKLAKLIPMLNNGPSAKKMLSDLGEKSKSKNVRGVAKFTVLEEEIEAADYPRTGKSPDPKEVAEKFKDLGVKLNAITTDYGDVEIAQGRGSSTIAKAADKLKFFMDNLTIGKTLPDVSAETLKGEKAKISDYRGKVLVVDIWATWCGPCRAMIPHEREMVEKRKDKKFVLLSVSADDKKETLEKFLEKEEMPWDHWWDGRGGEVTSKLQVKFFPTIYVLDAKGVIRYKHVRGEAMDKAVDELLKEMENSGGQ